MIEIAQNTSATLTNTFSAGDADSGVTITVTDQDNNVIVNAAAAAHAGTGVYTYTLAPQTQPLWLVVKWAGTWGGVAQSIATGGGQPDGQPAEVQVASGHLFTVAQLRALFTDLANTSTYPDSTLIDTRSRVTQLFEDYCNVAFVNRYGRASVDGTMTRTLYVPNYRINKIRACTINGNALSNQDLALITAYPYGKLDRLALWPVYVTPQNIVVSYEHGYTSTPQDVARAAMILAHYELTTSQLADRYISMSNDLGIIRLSLPDWSKKLATGIPIVDEVLNRYRVTPPQELVM